MSNKRGIGYDILSRHPDGRERHIEVKSRCSVMAPHLTENEKEKSITDPDYVLDFHVIEGNTATESKRVNDPAELRTKQITAHEVPISEIDRLGEDF